MTGLGMGLMGPTWLLDLLAGVMLATAAYCVGRFVVATAARRVTHRDVEVAHVLMGLAMAGALVPSLHTLPDEIWEIVFAVLAAWFGIDVVRFVRRCGWGGWDADECHHVSHFASHLVMTLAMVFMFAATASSDLDTSGLPLLFVLLLMVAAVWYADSVARFSRAGVGAPAAAPQLALAEGGGGSTRVASRLRLGAPVHSACDDRWLAPRLQVATHISMCVVMAYMLVVMQ
jgi:hypothetical protein